MTSNSARFSVSVSRNRRKSRPSPNSSNIVITALKKRDTCVGLPPPRIIEADTHQQFSGTKTQIRQIVNGRIRRFFVGTLFTFFQKITLLFYTIFVFETIIFSLLSEKDMCYNPKNREKGCTGLPRLKLLCKFQEKKSFS